MGGRESGANTWRGTRGQTTEKEAQEFAQTGDIQHTELDRRHDGQSSSLVGEAGEDREERLAEKDTTGSSSSKIFIGASVAGGVLATLVMAACWRWRASCCCSSSKNKSAQLEPATNIVVGHSPYQNKIEAVQAGSTVVVGVPIEGEADLECGVEKPN